MRNRLTALVVLPFWSVAAGAQGYLPLVDVPEYDLSVVRNHCRGASHQLRGVEQIAVFNACVEMEEIHHRLSTKLWPLIPVESQHKCLAEGREIPQFKFYYKLEACIMRESSLTRAGKPLCGRSSTEICSGVSNWPPFITPMEKMDREKGNPYLGALDSPEGIQSWSKLK